VIKSVIVLASSSGHEESREKRKAELRKREKVKKLKLLQRYIGHREEAGGSKKYVKEVTC
jgi:hypothetical protein